MRRAYNNFIERHELAMAYHAGGVLLIKGAAILVTLVLVLSAARFPKLVVLGGATPPHSAYWACC
jgi:hypothetical protein